MATPRWYAAQKAEFGLGYATFRVKTLAAYTYVRVLIKGYDNKRNFMKLSPKLLKRVLNFYPPYLGAGVKVEYISDDWKELHVSMRIRWYNRNAVGTHFGGSLYSMIDPHLMLLLMQLLGKDYLVWDKSANIEFVKASKKKVRSVIKVTDETLEKIKRNTEKGDKYFARFYVEIKDDDNDLIAKAEKVIYVRKKLTSDQS